MLQVNWPVVDTIHTLSNKFAMGVKIKATGELKLNDSPVTYLPTFCSWKLWTHFFLLTGPISQNDRGGPQ